MEASYECYLRNGVLHFYLLLSKFRPCIVKLWGSNPDPLAFRSRNIVGMVGGRPEATLPPDASSTLFVEGLPADCTRKEVSHIFRPFGGYKEVRLVPTYDEVDIINLCSVDERTGRLFDCLIAVI
ncbi:hypothetical protein KY290_027381 [Solanum tuberosum]|uniref:RRM domain-containing protein n=1 Tax=Solanum tuberosum TaxID=4113 RepID=A0ABQ7UGJ9_SOLTU|nr:hypothetical protein KY290_027381 [Solanum tuberosum]